jgi:multimeric flavodoxin WrbA
MGDPFYSNIDRKKGIDMSDKPFVVAVNGSPHAGFGNTTMMIEMLRAPLQEAGFALEVINLTQHEIGYCQGCALCLEKGACWIGDDHKKIVKKLLDAAGVILASPVYVFQVTAQMKTFLDRSLGFGHKPRSTWKPGLVISVSAGLGEVAVAEYLSSVLRIFGCYSVGRLTAIAISPGQFLGKEAVEARARDLARDLARAIIDKQPYPATEMDLRFYQFMGNLVKGEKDSAMKDDYAHWEKLGLYEGFEKYIHQTVTPVPDNPELRQAWVQHLIKEHKKRKQEKSAQQG